MSEFYQKDTAPIYIALFGCFCLFSGILAGCLLIFFSVFLFVARLSKPDPERVSSILQSYKSQIIAHRGAGIDSPENTLAAFRKARADGADGVEFDLSYTSDGLPVVLHDDTIDRTTNGTGHIHQMTFEKCRSFSASSNHAKRSEFPNEKIPSLEETVALCLELDLRMYIDVKSDPDKSAAVLSALYKQHPELYSKAIVCSFNPLIIFKVRRADPGIVTGLTWRPWYVSCEDICGPYRPGPMYLCVLRCAADVLLYWAHHYFLWYFLNNAAFLLHRDYISKEVVQYFQQRGVQVVAWTVNNPLEKSHLLQNIKIPIMTDTLRQ